MLYRDGKCNTVLELAESGYEPQTSSTQVLTSVANCLSIYMLRKPA